jgi:hypothetical protein
MPRNNESRLGTEKTEKDPPIPEKKSVLDFVLPTEFVDLPTQGRFYPEDHPLHNVDAIEIRYMTAKDTDILTSKSLLKKGIAIDRMLQNVIVDKNIKVNELFLGDKNAILVASRINGFGEQYEVKVGCTSCGISSNHAFDLSEIKSKEAPEDIKISDDGTFSIMLPKTEIEVKCRLLSGKDEDKLFASSLSNKKHKLEENTLTNQFRMLIVSLNGETDRRLVEKFIEVMPALDSNFLRKKYESIVPNVDLDFDFVCPECDAETVIDMPFSTEFFWPN